KADHTVTLGSGFNTINLCLGSTTTASSVTITDFKLGQDVLTYDGQEIDFDRLPNGASIVTTGIGWELTMQMTGYQPSTVYITSAPSEEVIYPVEVISGNIFTPESGYDPRGVFGDEIVESPVTYGSNSQYLTLQQGNVVGSTVNDTLTGGDGDETFHGGPGDDLIYGGRGNDFIFGGDGNDTLAGGRGVDTIVAGAGDDLISVDFDQDGYIWTGDGSDTIDITYSRRAMDIYVYDFDFTSDHLKIDGVEIDLSDMGEDFTRTDFLNGQKLTFTGEYARIDTDDDGVPDGHLAYNVWLVDADYTLPETLNVDESAYYTGFDSEYDPEDPLARLSEPRGEVLGNGTDIFWNNAQADANGHDTIWGSAGNDTVNGGGGNEVIYGEAGNDSLLGGIGNDTIYGGDQYDTIRGGDGDDELWGMFNADRFVFADGFGADVIMDFDAQNAFEKIDLSGVSAIVGLADLMANHTSQAGGHVLIDDLAGNTITLVGVTLGDLDASDFVF
ncbi:calcium-binding protein, partial [Hoeflea sp.]|uniref:calcium-binding protein n=1 Tax=Hoeflea sp. TaxID=1940281 RepID=UPI00198A704C